MFTSGLSEQDIEVIVGLLKKYPQVKEALLFGSRAKGTHQRGSDVDLALKGEDLGSAITSICGWLNDESPLPYYFDVVNYAALTDQPLKEHIDRVGKVVYCRS